MTERHAYALPFGAELIDGTRTRFRLWAPDAERVSVEIGGLTPIAMRRSSKGFFECEVFCGEGTRYRYRINDSRSVPDPASRLQDGDVHDASVVHDPRSFLWRCSEWRGRPWHEMVIYELHVGCCRGFAGIRSQLPELAELGITAIELMPIADFPGKRNWGYDGVLPFAPDTSYGTPNELKQLIDSAHALGICVYLDVVYNHFGPDGNFLNSYASAFFDASKHSPWGAAIDFSRPQVRDFFLQNALYWLLEYRFDGLRFDAVHQIADSGWLDEMAARIRETIEPGRFVHLVLENEHNRARHLGYGSRSPTGGDMRQPRNGGNFDAQWNDDGHNVLHVLLTGETTSYYRNYQENPAQKLARCLAEGFIYQGEPSPTHQMRPRGSSSAHLPSTAFVLFLQNHDQIGNRAFGERLTTLVEEQKLHAAIALLLLCPQIPLLFMGEEWGTRTPFLFFTDFHDELAAAVREGRRNEFSALPAFADPQLRATIPDPNAVSTCAESIPDPLEKKEPPHSQIREFYRRLLALRRERITPYLRDCRSLGASTVGEAGVVARWRLNDGSVLTIAINLDSHSVEIDASGDLIFASDNERAALRSGSATLQSEHTAEHVLPAQSTRVYLHAPAEDAEVR